MGFLGKMFNGGDEVSSKRVISILAIFMLVEMTQVWLFSAKVYDTTQFLFISGFWMSVAGYAQYLTVWKKRINLMEEKEEEKHAEKE